MAGLTVAMSVLILVSLFGVSSNSVSFMNLLVVLLLVGVVDLVIMVLIAARIICYCHQGLVTSADLISSTVKYCAAA